MNDRERTMLVQNLENIDYLRSDVFKEIFKTFTPGAQAQVKQLIERTTAEILRGNFDFPSGTASSSRRTDATAHACLRAIL